VVLQKYVRGGVYLVVEYRVEGQTFRATRRGQNPAVGTQAFSLWNPGDRIPVHYQPAQPAAALVGEPGPERRFVLEALAKRWALWGLLLTAYLPPFLRGLRRLAGMGSRPAVQNAA
jgi:hypothetical protein